MDSSEFRSTGQQLIDRFMSITTKSLQRTSSNLENVGQEFLKLKDMSVGKSKQASNVESYQTPNDLAKLKQDLGTSDPAQPKSMGIIGRLMQLTTATISAAFVGFGLLGDKFIKTLGTLLQVPLLTLTPGSKSLSGSGNTGEIKELIAQGEGTTDAEAQQRGFNSGYDVPYGYGKYAMPERNLTEMSIAEVQKFQAAQIAATKGKVPGTAQGTGAVGRYQFTQGTLERLVKKAGIDPTTKFTPEIQDKLAEILIAEAIAKGNGDPEKIADNLAKIWASLPTETGQGYYEGQGARVSRESLERAAQQINVGEKLNIEGDPEQPNEPVVVYVPVPIEKEGGAAPPSPTLSDVKARLQPDTSGPDRIKNGLNAAD